MVVCKFFLQGNCKFGDMCKFEHQINDNYQNNTSILRQQNYQSFSSSHTHADVSSENSLLTVIKKDMMAAEEGHQWPLSSYSPIRETPSFPGLEDQSFEDIRWGYYEARLNGTVEQYCQQLQMILQKAIMQMKFLQNPTPDVINAILSFYSSPNVNNPTATSPFPTSNALPESQAPSATSFFAAANKQIFGPQQHQTAGSIFANNRDMFNRQQSPQESVSPFTNVHHQNASGNIPFLKVEQPRSVPVFEPAAVPQPSVFAGNVLGSNARTVAPDESAYSKLEDLTEDEIKIFQSENFEFGKIPEKPPTKEMCS